MNRAGTGDSTLPQPFWMGGKPLAADPAAARRQWLFGWLALVAAPTCLAVGVLTAVAYPASGSVWIGIGMVCLVGVSLCRRGLAPVVSVLIYAAVLIGSLLVILDEPTNPASSVGLVCLLVLVATVESMEATLLMLALCVAAALLPLLGRPPAAPALPPGANFASRVAYLVVVGGIVVAAARSSRHILDEARARGRRNEELTSRLARDLETLELQVAERTQALAERTVELERITAELDESICSEVTLAAEMRRLAETDDLTGLANRRGFLALLGDAPRTGGWLAVADLDHFKRINDNFGHPIGDQVLQRAAQLMASAVPPGSTVARIGGEEFGIILADGPAGPRTAEQADQIFAAVVDAIRSAQWSGLGTPCGRELHVSASIGAARFDGGAGGSDALSQVWRRADAALYSAKDDGRGRSRISR